MVIPNVIKKWTKVRKEWLGKGATGVELRVIINL